MTVSKLRQEAQALIPEGLNKKDHRKLENELVGKKLYLDALAKTGTVSHALKAARVPQSALLRWREHDLEFSMAEREARDNVADALEAEAIRRAWKGVRKPVYQGGLLAGYVMEYSDSLLMFMLKAMRPEKYRERQDINVNPIIKVVSGFEPSEVI